jgi:hypothetical protein
MGSGAKSYIYEEGLSNIWANFSPYMRRPLVIYDFAPDPSSFPYIWGKFSFLFYQCMETENTVESKKARSLKWCCKGFMLLNICQSTFESWREKLICGTPICFVYLQKPVNEMYNCCWVQFFKYSWRGSIVI